MTGTPPTTVTGVRLWRWRRNPIRRHSDVVEAWAVLPIWAVALVGGVLAGVVAARATDSAFAARRDQVHSVSAVLTDEAAKTRGSRRSFRAPLRAAGSPCGRTAPAGSSLRRPAARWLCCRWF
ncbi:hypothetical protein ACIBJF_48150 [Streptomyces sp. NPDC050743]|uniref:hypothetical protein n=1 Tax=Streptomyces sp. NPDC050743 TaxID=3365634 RepID=UPI0037942193